MKNLLPATLMAIAFLLAGCARDGVDVIVTKDVNIAVPVPCAVDTKNQRPALMTLEELQKQLEGAPNIDTKAQIVTAQLLAYMGWLPVVESAMKGCEMAPKPAQ